VAGDRGGGELSDVPRGTWLNRGERILYDSAWVQLAIADVVMPDGTQVDHHVVRMPREAAGTIIVREGRVLLMYRHRFITDTWGWEIPAGAVDAGETLEQGAIRYRVPAGVALDAVVGVDHDDRRFLEDARLGIPGGAERRVEGIAVDPRLDCCDAHQSPL